MDYNNLALYLREKYGGKIGKVCIDGGFTCPNRDGKCGTGGCSFCGERGSGEHLRRESITMQIMHRVAGDSSYKGYIAYFQNFTNTYAPIEALREKYDEALRFKDKFVALSIGTRPDCIDRDVAELLAEYKNKIDVWVELGLQSASDITAERINRGYPLETYRNAAKILNEYEIPFVTHMIIGLEGEGEPEIDATIDEINASGAFGIKIHSLFVIEGTRLAEEYRSGLFTPMGRDTFVRLCARSIARLKPDMIVHRLTGDPPQGMLVAPEWAGENKHKLLDDIRDELKKNGHKQGSLYTKA